MDTVLESPVCLEHSERMARWTCTRCGRFACDTCVNVQRVCHSCVTRQLLTLSSSSPRARWTIRFLFANVVTDALSALAGVWTLLVGPSELRDAAEGLAGFGACGLTLATPIAFLMWLHLAVRQTQTLGIDVGVTPGWAVGCWFIPFWNLVKPYRVIRELLGGLGGAALVGTAHVGLWWCFWLAAHVQWKNQTEVSNNGHVEIFISNETYVVAILAKLASVVSAILCVRIIRAAQQTLDAKRLTSS